MRFRAAADGFVVRLAVPDGQRDARGLTALDEIGAFRQFFRRESDELQYVKERLD